MKRFLFILALFFVGMLSDLRAADVVSKLDRNFKSIRDLKATFTQKVVNTSLETTKNSEGVLSIKKPNLVRWEIKTPDPSLFVTNGKTAWYYTPPFMEGDQGTALKRKGSQITDNLSLRLLSGQVDIKKEFKAKVLAGNQIELVPRDQKNHDAEKIVVTPSENFMVLSKVKIFHRGGNTTEVELKKVQINQGIQSQIFAFTPPKNTAIVDEN